MAALDEFALIRLLTGTGRPSSSAADNGLVVGIGDDAAVAAWPAGRQLVMACDTMVQGVHFTGETMEFADIGYKAMASNLSDIAAMGADPLYALVALSVPSEVPAERLQELYAGLYACADRYGTTLAGGDTTSSPAGMVVTVTVIGAVEPGRALLRSAARHGDAVFVTGEPGRSAAGLHALFAAARAGAGASARGEGVPAVPVEASGLAAAHRRPEPHVAAGRLLREHGCASLNDVSDGVASEAWEIAEASNCGLLLHEAELPIAADLAAYAAAVGGSAVAWLLFGGEDYCLLGTIPAERYEGLAAAFAAAGLPLYRIGEASSAFSGVRMLRADGSVEPVEKRGYNHFEGADKR